MKKVWLLGATMALAFGSTPAIAADTCPVTAICASNPAGIVTALQTLGYKAVLGKSESSGSPKISSAASGYTFDIFFYDCTKGAECGSITFLINFSKDPVNSASLANEWNKTKRFSAMSFDETDGMLTLSCDASTVGGLSQANFADVVNWWDAILGEARTFFKAYPAPAETVSPKKS